MRCRPSCSLSTLGSKHACDKNRRSSVTCASISVFPPHPISSSRTTKYVVCCCCLHIKSRSDLYLVPSNIRTGPTDANAFRGHRLTTQKGYTYATYKRGSTIGEGGDTTISSPGRSPKQSLPGMRPHDPLHGRRACPEFIAFNQGVGQICPR